MANNDGIVPVVPVIPPPLQQVQPVNPVVNAPPAGQINVPHA
jgi:hypothetical protein